MAPEGWIWNGTLCTSNNEALHFVLRGWVSASIPDSWRDRLCVMLEVGRERAEYIKRKKEREEKVEKEKED